METLGKIFGSQEKVRLMRVFLFNPGKAFDLDDIEERTKIDKRTARKEVENLQKIGLIKKKNFQKDLEVKKTTQGWIINESFTYLVQLQNLLVDTILMREDEIIDRLSEAGKVRLIIVSGVYLQDWDGRIDLLVVGDRLKDNILRSAIRKMEADIGKELHYAALETPDFQYRMSVCDRLVRDVLDFPHRVILDRLGMKLSFA